MRVPLSPALLRLPVAHRAYHSRADRRPENSPAAVQAAVDAGYAIEIDVQLSSDGVAMVFHDEELDRLTAEHGLLCDRTAADLAAIRLTDSDDGIPTLDQVLQIVAGQVPLLIELKDQTMVMGETDGRLEQAVATALRDYRGDVAVMSFNPYCMANMARLAPRIARGITTSSYDPGDWAPLPAEVCDRLRDIPDYDRVEASFISHQGDDLSRPRVDQLKRQGAAILCWTIRTPEQERLVRQLADNVTFEGYAAAIPA
ncbi:MAG: glycerophosphodiester phosphodiesterase family protein [Paracoccaceae bacterium]